MTTKNFSKIMIVIKLQFWMLGKSQCVWIQRKLVSWISNAISKYRSKSDSNIRRVYQYIQHIHTSKNVIQSKRFEVEWKIHNKSERIIEQKEHTIFFLATFKALISLYQMVKFELLRAWTEIMERYSKTPQSPSISIWLRSQR